jgi:hypothetical protein
MKILLALCLVSLTGCTLIAPAIGPRVAKSVNRYCQESYQARLLLRTEVNSLIVPNKVQVTCEGDPQ